MDTSKKIGRYEILEELGHGAMGTVYRAKDPAMDRVVALKTIISLVLVTEKGTEFRERFFREARAAGGLSHPGIVTVYDVGEHDGQPFLVMEFISGKTLADAVKQGERLTLDRVCEIGQKIAEALGYAHKRGVVHRDIKPANILLTSHEGHGIERPKITDFGVAKMVEGHTTMTGQMLGTPAFMPPEQFTGAPVDGRADIFSLGVVLYWMATGEQPFPGESMTAVSYKVVHTEPVPPRKLNPSIPAKLESVILKCLAKSPDERYQTGEELARDLGALRAGNTATVLQNTAPQAAAAGSDSDATLVESVPVVPAGPTTVRAPQPVVVAPETEKTNKTKSNGRFVLAAVAVAVIAAAGWFALRNREKPVAQTASPSVAVSEAPPALTSTPAAASMPEATATPTSKAPVAVKPSESAPKTLERNSAPLVAAEPPKKVETPAPAAEPAAVDFNPKSLDPKGNSKLKIEADRMPAGIDFTVEMNGKVYLQSSAEGNKTEIDNLYVPPGVQEFNVTARSGAVQKTSNTVSAEFQAKKRHTLKIELRSQGMPSGAGVPQGLYADSQIVLTLK
jgi:predicted Ser/Thr protein kinase